MSLSHLLCLILAISVQESVTYQVDLQLNCDKRTEETKTHHKKKRGWENKKMINIESFRVNLFYFFESLVRLVVIYGSKASQKLMKSAFWYLKGTLQEKYLVRLERAFNNIKFI